MKQPESVDYFHKSQLAEVAVPQYCPSVKNLHSYSPDRQLYVMGVPEPYTVDELPKRDIGTAAALASAVCSSMFAARCPEASEVLAEGVPSAVLRPGPRRNV